MHFAGFDEDEAWYARPRAKNPRAGTFRTTRIVHPEFADLIARRRFVRRDHSPTFATPPARIAQAAAPRGDVRGRARVHGRERRHPLRRGGRRRAPQAQSRVVRGGGRAPRQVRARVARGPLATARLRFPSRIARSFRFPRMLSHPSRSDSVSRPVARFFATGDPTTD